VALSAPLAHQLTEGYLWLFLLSALPAVKVTD
jgi:hypothetical protein